MQPREVASLLNPSIPASHGEATPGAAGIVAAPGDCYHCGLPVPRIGGRRSTLGGEPRAFCCAGCEAVAHAIVDQGLDDYYRYRAASPGRPADAAAGADEYAAFDDPVAQARFAAAGEGGDKEAVLLLEGIRCAACSWLIEQAMQRVPGVRAAQVNYATQRARLRWDPAAGRLSEVLRAVAAVGYRAHPYEAARLDALRATARRTALWRLLVAGLGMMQVMMYAVPAYVALEGTLPQDIALLMRWASLVLTVPVVLYSAQPFFAGAWRDLRMHRLGMDVPVALGIAVAFGASVLATLRATGEVYFDSITMFVFLLLLGRFVELGARQRATGLLDHLGKLVPEVCRRVTGPPGSLETTATPVAALAAGDVVLVSPGESVPADGVVLDGQSVVNEALLTGESRPIAKSAGARLIGGAVNVSGAVLMRVERVGADTILGTIARLAERATAERPRLVELADQVAHWFVLAVLAVALATAAWWLASDPGRALWVAVSVLVVTCPCALSLATPVALTAATGALARRGVLVTRGHALEALAHATDVVFDKTGTLTQGTLRVAGIDVLGSVERARCLTVARGIEQASEHAYAAAIRDFAATEGAAAAETSLPAVCVGAGIEAVVDGAPWRIGSAAYCAALAGTPAPEGDTGADATVVHLVRAGEWVARFRLSDSLKPDAARLIARLQAEGRTVHLLSGDAPAAVQRVADALGIARARSECLPDAKREYVRELQRAGRVVAMVGDGVNDAPVLAQADVSIAMASGARLAQVQADAVSMRGTAADLAGAFATADRAMRVVRQNLAWAIAYNLIALPAAVAGLVTPWLAGIGMAASSLAVVLNATRLVRDAPHGEERTPAVGAGG
ncbi:MAG: cadmium-translocating P-type ATPase [Burkholderiales bacterium]|nr:cadmium-translocating P-type ATPase [Burkholderiales bacterium]